MEVQVQGDGNRSLHGGNKELPLAELILEPEGLEGSESRLLSVAFPLDPVQWPETVSQV